MNLSDGYGVPTYLGAALHDEVNTRCELISRYPRSKL